MQRPRGRYAPTPSGWIHVGNARTALVTWLSIRAQGGTLIWRLEDLDPPRVLAGAPEAALEDLRWLGLDWDEGPEQGGPFEPYIQSARDDFYEKALQQLADGGRLFPCGLTRKEVQEASVAPHGSYGPRTAPYPATLRPATLAPLWYKRYLENDDSSPEKAVTLRFRVHDCPVTYEDRLQGTFTERVDEQVGDFILKRRDGLYAYQLAVVVDDILMEIDEIVRGMDLIDSTARQIQLIEALGGRRPTYAHLPMVLNGAGDKLSKRDGALTLRHLREHAVTPEALVGYLAFSLGLRERPTPCRASDLIDDFDIRRIRREDWRLPDDLTRELTRS